jgi:hypothetical protein
MNALYYARLTFLDLETANPNSVSDCKLLLIKSAESAYNACYLATHLDVNLKEIFSEELHFLQKKLTQIQKFCTDPAKASPKEIESSFFDSMKGKIWGKEVTEDTKKMLSFKAITAKLIGKKIAKKLKINPLKLKIKPLSYKVGKISGTVVDQMRPLGKEVDYNFLTTFSHRLPNYLNKLTKAIDNLSSQIKEQEPSLNQEKLDELRIAALHLLSDIEQLQGNNLFVSLKFLNYIHIIRNIITLSESTLEQAGQLTESSQNLVRDQLEQLKYNLLPTLFGLVDKIEVNTMVEPGTLSKPLMKQIKKLYKAIIYLPRKAIDFESKGAELLTIENSRFIELRLDLAYKRIDTANKKLDKIANTKTAITAFFKLLNEPKDKDYWIHQLPAAEKQQLIFHYKIIKPYMERLDPDLNNLIIERLLGSNIGPIYPTIIAKQKELNTLIEKDENSQLFHIDLNNDLINSVYKEADLTLLPYDINRASVSTLDETMALKVNINETKLILNKKEFTSLHEAFTELSVLISTYKQKHNERFSFGELSPENLNKLRDYHTRLHPYFSYLVAKDQKKNIKRLDNYLTAFLAQKKVDANDLISFKKLMPMLTQSKNNLDKIKKEWNSLFYNLKKRNFLSSKEVEEHLNAEAKKPRFKKENGHTLLQNHDDLSADKALEMNKWYGNKRNKLIVMDSKFIEFIDLLKTHHIRDNISAIGSLEGETKIKLRNLYNAFQPYFLEAIIPKHKQRALEFDRYLVALLTKKTVDPKQAPSIKWFEERKKEFDQFIEGCRLDWHQKSQFYLQLLQEKFIKENEETKLTPTPQGERADYMLKDTKLSQGVKTLRTSLNEMTRFFNQSMQKELKTKEDKKRPPYPEMEDPFQQLAQSMQVRAIKDIHNSLYHLEKIALDLEKLKEKNFQGTYSNPVAWIKAKYQKGNYVSIIRSAYNHIDEVIKLSKRMMKDPHFGFIFQEVLHKAQYLYATVQEHSSAYQVDAEQIEVPGTIQQNTLWYVLNAFYIGPKHFKTLKNINYLTAEELNQLQKQAKKATLTIEKLIKSSDSYFKLFLQSPNMLILYKELKQKLNEFTTTSHDAVFNNLDHIRALVFTPMLTEADQWEKKLGLVPGTLSEKLKQITDEYFKGLLYPFKYSKGIDSKTYIDLIYTEAPLNQRVKQVTQQINDAEEKLADKKKYFADISKLYQSMQDHKKLLSWAIPPSLIVIHASETSIAKQYKAVLPKLRKLALAERINIEPSTEKEDHVFDEICNQGLKEYEYHYTEVEAWVTAAHHYSLGIMATQQMLINSGKEKSNYLDRLRVKHQEGKKSYTRDYTYDAFRKHLNDVCEDPFGLIHTKDEYVTALRNHLLLKDKEKHINKREDIIAKALAADALNTKGDIINDSIKKALHADRFRFEEQHYAEYYHLDAISDAVNQIRTYTKGYTGMSNSLFESQETIRAKLKKLDELERIINNKRLPVDERIVQLQKLVKEPAFRDVMFAHPHSDPFTFAYLAMCVLYLLETIHLYTPKRKKLFHNVQNAMDNPVKTAELRNRFGLFAHSEEKKSSTKPTQKAQADQPIHEPTPTPAL